MTRYEIKGRVYWLYYNAEAMFILQDDADVKKMSTNERESLGAACRVAAVLGEQGELMRRHQGYDRSQMPDAEELQLIATPKDLVRMKKALIREISIGLEMEVEPEGDVDVGLAQLAAKNKKK